MLISASRSVPARHILSRFLFALFGMLLLAAACYVWLGWALYKKSPRLRNSLGEKQFQNLTFAYARALAWLRSKDSDGDGFPDSLEFYLGTNPKDRSSHPPTDFIFDDWGIQFIGVNTGTSEDVNLFPHFVLQPGERRHIRARLGAREQKGIGPHRLVFSPGMQLLLAPAYPALSCLAGGTPGPNPLLIPVSADGVMEFDLVVPNNPDAYDLNAAIGIYAEQPGSRETLGMFSIRIARRQEPIPCKVEEYSSGTSFRPPKDMHTIRLTWEPANPKELFFIEATRDETGREWFPIGIGTQSGINPAFVTSYEIMDTPYSHHGPLRFRVIPVKASGQ
jgi:hypothetical protein